MKKILFSLLFLVLLPMHFGSFATAESKLKVHRNQIFSRGTFKKGTIVEKEGQWIFETQALSGKKYSYSLRNFHSGLVAIFKKENPISEFVLKGKFHFSGDNSFVDAEHLYPLLSHYHGVRVVKWDGFSPTFTASVLSPTDSNQPIEMFRVYGRLHSKWNYKDNQLLCLFGDWFKVKNKKRGIVYQVNGLLGNSLKWFSKAFKQPRHWEKLLTYKEKYKAFQENKKRKPNAKKEWIHPLLSETKYKKYISVCLQRLNPLQKKFNTSKDFLFSK